MHTKIIKQLINESYTDGQLDNTKVTKIAGILGRRDLKQYIKFLKKREREITVVVTMPDINDIDTALFEKLFADKKIVMKKDPQMILGVNITDNDLVYEFNLKNTLEKMVQYVSEETTN